MIKIIALYAAFAMLIGMSTVTMAQELEDALTNHPNPVWAEYYRENAEEIISLRAQAIQGEPTERIEALERLALLYPDAVLSTAIELLDDNTLEVALKAAELLAASIVMTDHDMAMHGNVNLNPQLEYAVAQYTATREALLDSLEDPRSELRSVAAGILASISDEEALSRIDAGVQQGLYSQFEAANYFGLARFDIGAQYLEPYLEDTDASVDARIAAVTYLGSSSQYQTRVRDAVLFNAELDPSVRGAAAEILSTYDPSYQSYALTVTLDPNIPPTLYITVVEGYIENLQADGTLNAVIAGSLQTAIENFSLQNLDIDIEPIKSILEQYSGPEVGP